MDKLEDAGQFGNSLHVERPYYEPGLLLGTSAFTAAGWEGSFYPADPHYYARHTVIKAQVELQQKNLSATNRYQQARRRSQRNTMKKNTLVEMKIQTPKDVNEHPWTVPEAANFLGVSPQTVYLWVERKQIPHLRVMGRNIRLLKSDLETFRASFK
jgi:excisionase family DNA binding protein